MKYRGAFVRGANVDPLACVVFLRVLQSPEVAPFLSRYLRGLALQPGGAGAPTIRQVEAALGQMHAAHAEYRRLVVDQEGFVDETTKPIAEAAKAGSASPPSGHLTVAEVAERLTVSQQYVRRLCSRQILSATHRGRAWVIDVGSVIEFEASRSTAA